MKDRIKKARCAKAITQEELAKAIGVGRAVISKYENDFITPKIETIEKIAKVLNVTPAYLMGWEDFDPPTKEKDLWFYNFENKLKEIGYGLDFYEEDMMTWVVYPDGTLEVQMPQLQDLNAEMNSFLRFKLEELKNNNLSDFRPNNKKTKKGS